ncbi:MAG: hypothetical protein ACXWC4_23795 [Telluria sp.]
MPPVRLLLAALLLPCPLLAAAGDFTDRCEREMKPVLEVHAHEADFDVVSVVASRVLNTRVSDGSASHMTLGMTSGTHRTEITLDAPALRDNASRRECVSPRIYVDLAYKPLQVFVAREFHQQSCAYRTVYAHEMRHVQVYRDNLPVLERRVRDALEQRYGKRPLYLPAEAGIKQLETDVDTWLRPFIKELLADVERQQAALDSPEEIFLLSHACLGEVEAAMGSSF